MLGAQSRTAIAPRLVEWVKELRMKLRTPGGPVNRLGVAKRKSGSKTIKVSEAEGKGFPGNKDMGGHTCLYNMLVCYDQLCQNTGVRAMASIQYCSQFLWLEFGSSLV